MDESLSVLVVDDDVSIQNVVEEILRDGGFEPKAASSGEGTATYADLRMGFIALRQGKAAEGRNILRQISDEVSRAARVDSESPLLPLTLMGISAALGDLPGVRSSLRSEIYLTHGGCCVKSFTISRVAGSFRGRHPPRASRDGGPSAYLQFSFL